MGQCSTSNAGWDTIKQYNFLKEIISEFKEKILELPYS